MQSGERKRHRLARIFRAKPNAAGSKNDTAVRIAAENSVLTTPDVPDILTQGISSPSTQAQSAGADEDDQQKCSVTPNQSQNDGHEIVIAPAVSIKTATKAVGDVNAPLDLWRHAYQDLKTRNKSLVEKFEQSIMNIANPTSGTEKIPFDHNTIEMIVRQKLDARKAKRLSIQLGKYPVEFREVSEKIIKGILWSSTFISAAVSAQPYAALAWSGVSIILPLLLNNSKQNVTMIEGLENITKLMQLFRIREEIYLQDVRRPPQPDFETAVVELYSAVFEYEARVITHLSDPTVTRGISSTFELNGWDTMMARIHAANQHCEAFANLFDRSREAEQLASIKEIFSSLQSFQEDHQRYRQEDQETRLLHTLTLDYKTDKEVVSERIDGTCEWFFDNQAFTNWRDSNITSLLWVSGGPGCGKTVLSKALIDKMLFADNVLPSTVCYFFFKAGQEQKELAADALSAILHQLFQTTNLISYGFASYKRHGAKLSKMFSDLWEILMECAKDSAAGKIICVIDALDECKKESREQFMKEIIHYFSSSKSTHQRVGCSLKFLVTSQPCKDIKDQFERLSEDSSYVHIDIENHSADLGRDIDLVIDRQVSDFARKFNSEKQKFIADHLKSRDKRTYLWLFLIIDIIKESSIKYSKFPNVKQLLFGLPDEVSDAYNRILSRSEEPELAKTLLKIIAAATRPLTLTETNIALTIATYHQQGMAHEELDLFSPNDFPSILKNLCGLMVTIHDDKLSLFHPTVSGFLIAKSPADSPIATQHLSTMGSVSSALTRRAWEGCLDISNAHGLMCQICLNYLTLSNFAIRLEGVGQIVNYDSDDDDGKSNGWFFEYVDRDDETRSLSAFVEESLERYAFLDYSALNWPYHYRHQDQQHRSISHIDAELMCNPNSSCFFNWASVSSSKRRSDFLSGCDGLGIASYFGLADLVEKFSLSVQDIDAYQPIYPAYLTKDTALRIAIERGFPDVVRVLLKRGADSSLQDKYGGSPLHEALQANFFVPLSEKLAILQMLFDSGLEINSKIVKGDTALYHASLFSSEDVVEFLVEQGADLEAPTGHWNWTPLQEAIVLGHERQAAIFLKHGADFKAHTNSGNVICRGADGSAIHIAAYTARANIVDLLIRHGADVNTFGGNHGTALIAACSGSWEAAERLRTVRILIENNANIHAVGKKGDNAMQAASFNGQAEIVALLLLKGADVNSWGGKYGTALIAACCHIGTEAALETVKVLINNSADINAPGEHHGNALYEAASRGHHSVVRLLIEAKADVNTRDDPTKAPLVATCRGEEGHMETAKALLENGADINASESFAVKMASMFGSKEMVNFLVTNGASLKASESGYTALHAAAMYARADIADVLIAFGVAVDSYHFQWGTPLHLACSEMADEVILTDLYEPTMNLDSSIDTQVENNAHLLAKVDEIVSGSLSVRLRKKKVEKRLQLVRLLVEKKANVNARRAGGISVLHDALKRDDQELVGFLIANGATDQEGEKVNMEEDETCRAGTDDDEGNGSNNGT